MSDSVRRLRAAFLSLAILAALGVVPLAALHAAGPAAAPPPEADGLPPAETPNEVLGALVDRPAADKLVGDLAAQKADAATDTHVVYVQSDRAVDFKAVARRWHAWTLPAGEHVAFVEVTSAKLEALAQLPGVARVSDAELGAVGPIEMPARENADGSPYVATPPTEAELAELRRQARSAPPWQPVDIDVVTGAKARAAAEAAARDEGLNDEAAKGGATPKGWHDIWRGHAAKEAWDLGFTGKGVKVAVLDTSVDFAHPDLQGAYATYDKGVYAGWPEVFDPTGMGAWAQDETLPVTNGPARTAVGSVGIVQMTRTVTETAATVNGKSVMTGCVESRAVVRINNRNVVQSLAPNCTFILPASKSGRLLHGYHPDGNIRGLGGEPNAVPAVVQRWLDIVLADPNTAGVYDTVYVDLNFNRDFTDDKPMTKADPVGWRDINGNGIADLSAGMLYWIADGKNPPPGAYLYGLSDHIPAAYSVIGIQADTGGHGTLCASNVASRGRLGVPKDVTLSFSDLPGNGKPMPMNPGMGKEAMVVAVGDIYSGGNAAFDTGWRFGVLGADPADKSDDPQITSNSYGFSGQDDDGWDVFTRAIDYYVRTYNPTSMALYSAGNGGPGYGTRPAPNPQTGMNIAASTQMGSTGWDSIRNTSQITFGDITPWSDRGPGGIGNIGPNIATDGAYASGSNPLNAAVVAANPPEFKRDGEYANSTWGGTSRSSPVAAGLMSLVYQAFHDKHGRWPTWQEAKSIAMAGSRFNGYDAFITGAGVLDAADAARIAGGLYGVAAQPAEWTAGGYRGKTYPGFARVQEPGTTSKQTFTLSNVDDKPVDVTVSAQSLRRIGHHDIDWQSKPVTDEVGSPTSFNAPTYFVPMDKDWVPAGTDLMIVHMVYPLGDMDLQAPDAGPWNPGQPGSSYLFVDNSWRLTVYQHTDFNDDQKLWNDRNGNGIVDFQMTNFVTQTLDAAGGTQRLIDYKTAEIQQGEYERFAYLNNEANNHLVAVHHPLERWSSGIYIGLTHWETGTGTPNARGRTPKVPVTKLKLRVDFYKYSDWSWLKVDKSTITIPAASGAEPGTATVEGTMQLPSDAPYGAYVGAIFADYARDAAGGDKSVYNPATGELGGYELPNRRTVIPVSVNVAAQYRWNGPITFGGASAFDADAPYNNGAVAGAQSWNWRPESGDWRYFFFDALTPPKNTLSFLMTRTRWTDPSAKQTDIDTRLYGPLPDRYSDPTNSANATPEADGGSGQRGDRDWYGPYTLGLLANSPRNGNQQYFGAGKWGFDTSTGENEDWLSTSSGEGLHEIMLDNVLFSGSSVEIPFETTVGSIRVSPAPVSLDGDACVDLTVKSDLPLDDVLVQAYGLVTPTVYKDQVAHQDDQNSAASASYKKGFELPDEAPILRITVDGADDADLDVYLLYDTDGDGNFDFATEQYATAPNGGSADEEILLTTPSPAGKYEVWVHGFTVTGTGSKFDLTIDPLYGDDIAVENPPSSLPAGAPQTLRLCPDAAAVAGRTAPANGVVFLGPSSTPYMVTIPVKWYPRGTAPTPEPEAPTGIYLPALLKADMFGGGMPAPAAVGRAFLNAAKAAPTR